MELVGSGGGDGGVGASRGFTMTMELVGSGGGDGGVGASRGLAVTVFPAWGLDG